MKRRLDWLVLALGLAGLVYFGARHRVRDEPNTSPNSHADSFRGKTFRLLLAGDPFAAALKAASPILSQRSGANLEIEVTGYSDVRRLILQNAKDEVSSFEVVSFDVVWGGELAAAKALTPLRVDRAPMLEPSDFLPIAFAQSHVGGAVLGLPLQPHPELLWIREDLLTKAGLSPPVTTDDVIRVATALARPSDGLAGVCWNGQQGHALGQQMAHFYGAFGQPLLDATGHPTLDTPRGLEAAKFAKSLLALSPPDILTMAWDQRVHAFARGKCAILWEWGARAPLAERDPSSLVAGKIVYTAAPHAPGAPAVTPLGTWSLGIPSNLGVRREVVEQFLFWLSQPEQQKMLAEMGNGGMPRTSLLGDPALVARYPTFPAVERLSREGELGDGMRPRVPQWSALSEMMGTVFHEMLEGKMEPAAAVARAQSEAELLFSVRNP